MSTQFYVVFDDHLSMTYNDMTLEDTAVEDIFNDWSESCRDLYGEETIAPEGASAESPIEENPDDLPPELDEKL